MSNSYIQLSIDHAWGDTLILIGSVTATEDIIMVHTDTVQFSDC